MRRSSWNPGVAMDPEYSRDVSIVYESWISRIFCVKSEIFHYARLVSPILWYLNSGVDWNGTCPMNVRDSGQTSKIPHEKSHQKSRENLDLMSKAQRSPTQAFGSLFSWDPTCHEFPHEILLCNNKRENLPCWRWTHEKYKSQHCWDLSSKRNLIGGRTAIGPRGAYSR